MKTKNEQGGWIIPAELSDADADDYCDGYDAITIKQLIEHHLDGVIVRCGNIIQ